LLFNGEWHGLFLLNYCSVITLLINKTGHNLFDNNKLKIKIKIKIKIKNKYKYLLNSSPDKYFRVFRLPA